MTFIADIDPATPGANDPAGQGDDQIRNLKQDIVDTIGGLDAEVTEPDGGGTKKLTAATMSSWEARIATLEAGSLPGPGEPGSVPVGMIAIWSDNSPVPTGWWWCDGSVAPNGIQTPDFRGLVLAGAGSSETNKIKLAVGATGGSVNGNTESDGAHTHALTIAQHALTQAQMPEHGHAMFGEQAPTGDDIGLLETAAFKRNPGSNDDYAIKRVDGSATRGVTNTTGSGNPHGHPGSTAQSNGGHDHELKEFFPPSFGVKFIMYVGA